MVMGEDEEIRWEALQPTQTLKVTNGIVGSSKANFLWLIPEAGIWKVLQC